MWASARFRMVMGGLSRPERRTDLCLMLALLAAGALLRGLVVARTGFDGLYGQDAYAYYDFAGELQRAAKDGDAPGAFFWPLGYPALLAGVFTFSGMNPEVGQFVNMVMGALLPPLVYGLARRMGREISGALAAGMAMVGCGQALLSSVVLMSDIPALVWAVMSAVVLWGGKSGAASPGRTGKLSAGRWLMCGALLGLAIITRWLYLALLPAWVIWLAVERRWRGIGYVLAGAALALLPQVVYARTSPTPMLSHAWVEGWSGANFFEHSFDTVDGHLDYQQANAAFYARPFYDVSYLSGDLTAFVIVGAVMMILRRRSEALFVMAWVLPAYVFLAGIPYQNSRFALIMFPAAALLLGAGVEAAAGWVKGWRGGWRTAGELGTAALLLTGLLHGMAAGVNGTQTFIRVQERDKAAAAWANNLVPAGARVYSFGLTLTLKHYTDLEVYEMYYETPETLAAGWIPGQADYMLVNLWNINNQWAGREPQIAYRWLREQRGLNHLGRYGDYTLFRVKG